MTGSAASLAGIALDGSAPIVWEQTPGVQPNQTVVNIEREAGALILDKGFVPLELKLAGRSIKGVYCLGSTAGNSREYISLILADFRFLWQYKSGRVRFNIKERSNFVRLLGQDEREENRVLSDKVRYKASTLKDRRRVYSFEEAIRKVFDEIIGEPVLLGSLDRATELEDFDEEGPAPGILQGLLDQLGGYSIRPTDEGVAQFFDRLDGGESSQLAREDSYFLSSGWVEISDRRNERPSGIDFYFTCEPEIRANFFDGAGSRTVEDGREPIRLENVIRSPVREMLIDGEVTGQRIAEGTPITFQQLYDALPNALSLPSNAVDIGYLSDQIIREFYLGRGEFGLIYKYQTETFPDDEWRRVIVQVGKDWRRLFRLIKPWRDRITKILPHRGAIYDYTNLSRAKAQVFCDYTEVPSKRNWHVTKISKSNLESGYVKKGWASLLTDASDAPGDFKVEDAEGGLFNFFLKRDSWGDLERIIPGEVDQLPSWIEDPSKGFYSVIAQLPLLDLWYLSAVFSVIPEPEHGLNSYYKISVNPSQASRALRQPVGDCLGPRMSVMIPSTDTTRARFGWLDNLAPLILEYFYSGAPLDGRLLLNGPHLNQIAMGEAARIYSALLDRPEGSYSTHIGSPGILAGSYSSIRYLIAPNGAMSKSAFLGRLEAEPDALAFASPLARREIRGVIER